MGIIEQIEYKVGRMNGTLNNIEITVCDNRDRIGMIENRLDLLLKQTEPEDRTKVEEETKDSLTKNDGEDVTHNTGKVNRDG